MTHLRSYSTRLKDLDHHSSLKWQRWTLVASLATGAGSEGTGSRRSNLLLTGVLPKRSTQRQDGERVPVVVDLLQLSAGTRAGRWGESRWASSRRSSCCCCVHLLLPWWL